MNRTPSTRLAHRPAHRTAAPIAAIAVLVVVVAVAATGGSIAPHGVTEVVGSPFTNEGVLGTDRLGRDVWSRLLAGGAPVLATSALATTVATAIGVPLGVLTAGRRRRRSALTARFLDVAIVVPPLTVLLVVLGRLDDSTLVIGGTVGIVGAPIAARVTLAAADPVWRRAHVEQAVLRGERRTWIAVHEVIPSIVGPLVADAGLRFAAAVSVTSAMSVLGYGPDPPATDWASQLVDNLSGAPLNPWASAGPALAITALAVTANIAADLAARRTAR